MDFDLDGLMVEVTAALGNESTRPRKRRRRADTAARKDDPDIDLGADFGEFFDYLSYEQYAQSPNHHPGQDASGSEDGNDFGDTDPHDAWPDNNPALYLPNLDMTTAILSGHDRHRHPSSAPEEEGNGPVETYLRTTEPLHLVPTFYSYAIKACLSPIRRVQHELVTLYFKHIHPMFPVVDEHYLTELHRNYRGQEELMEPSDFLLYYAIMVAGFAHLSQKQVFRTPYRSVHEGQAAQIEQLKARYWSQPTSDSIVLTQVTLILTLWSPAKPSPPNNSYWLDMAFNHATTANLWDTNSGSSAKYARKKVLRWCCLVRDRVLALGMRRPHRLHKAPIEGDDIVEEDFGLEASHPSYTDLRTKRKAILAFIWFCKLSNIMAELAIFQRRRKFIRDWNGDSLENSISELQEVTKFYDELGQWLRDFEEAESNLLEDIGDRQIPVPILTLRIIFHSLRGSLYVPYLNLKEVGDPSSDGSVIDPLQRLKDGAQGVAINLTKIMSTKEGDSLPVWLASWVTLPVAVYHVSQRLKPGGVSDQAIMRFFAQLVRRSSGAQMLLTIVRKATKALVDGTSETSPASDPSRSTVNFSSSDFHFVYLNPLQGPSDNNAEAKVLASVAQCVDFALEHNGDVRREEEEKEKTPPPLVEIET